MRDKILNNICNHIKKTTEVTSMNKCRKGNDRGNQGLRRMVLRKLGLETGHVFLRAEVKHAPAMMRVENKFFPPHGAQGLFSLHLDILCALW